MGWIFGIIVFPLLAIPAIFSILQKVPIDLSVSQSSALTSKCKVFATEIPMFSHQFPASLAVHKNPEWIVVVGTLCRALPVMGQISVFDKFSDFQLGPNAGVAIRFWVLESSNLQSKISCFAIKKSDNAEPLGPSSKQKHLDTHNPWTQECNILSPTNETIHSSTVIKWRC